MEGRALTTAAAFMKGVTRSRKGSCTGLFFDHHFEEFRKFQWPRHENARKFQHVTRVLAILVFRLKLGDLFPHAIF